MSEPTSRSASTEPPDRAEPPDHAESADHPVSYEGSTHVATQTDLLAHPGIVTVTSRLRELGAPGEIHVFSAGVRTAKAAAEALGCEVGAIANSLIFDAAGSPVLISPRVPTGSTRSRPPR